MHLTQDQVNERLKNKGFLALDVLKIWIWSLKSSV